jgi:hypothetical protein
MIVSENDAPVAHACAVHLGFAGARDLFPGIGDPQRRVKFAEELTRQVTQKLSQLRAHPRLPLHEGHFFVGVMQIGSGGEGVLADACDSNGIALRVFLPQARDEFLAARSPRAPFDDDFSPAQREKAQQRLQRASVLQERVVTTASERTARFADTTAAILREADIAVILQPKHRDGLGKPGRTNEFAEHALRCGKPLYALTFWIDENQKLHVYDELRYPRDLNWAPPRLPAVVPLPALALDDLAERVAADCGQQAQACNEQCAQASKAVVRTHIACVAAATVLLILVNLFRNGITGASAWLLLPATLLPLAAGIFLSRRTLSANATSALRRRWTDLHLAAELARSVLTFAPTDGDRDPAVPPFAGQRHGFEFLMTAPLPDDLRPLAQTLAVAHWRRLRDQRRPSDWQEARDRYRRERLEHATTGQLAVYRTKFEQVQRHLREVNRQCAWLGAFAAVIVAATLILPTPAVHIAGTIAAAFALLAVLVPAAALALQAQRCVFKHRLRALACAELLEHLQRLSLQLQRAPNESDFLALQAETETRLLAATLDWYRWRRYDA